MPVWRRTSGDSTGVRRVGQPDHAVVDELAVRCRGPRCRRARSGFHHWLSVKS